MRTLTLTLLLALQLFAQSASTTITGKDSDFLVTSTGVITTITLPAFYSFRNVDGTEYMRITMSPTGMSIESVEYNLPHSKITLTGPEFERALIDFARKRERESKNIPLPGSVSWTVPTFPSNVP